MEEKRYCILVVDDGPGMLDFFEYFFEQEQGYRVLNASADEKTFELTRRLAPDLLLFDSHTWPPRLIQPLIEQLRADPATQQISIVVCSAAFSLVADLRPFCQRHGAHCIDKPFELEHLLRVVRGALQGADGSRGT